VETPCPFFFINKEVIMKMDDEINEMLFFTVSDDCEWVKIGDGKYPLSTQHIKNCKATGMACNQKNCMPFKFAKFFNKPEVRRG
jgi:hypothetical protein